MTREEVLAEARSWLNTPYHHQGRIKGAGVDCGQLLLAVYAAVGIIPDTEVGNYSNEWHLHRDEERYLGWVEKFAHQVETPKPGDIALFKFGRCVSHGAIVVQWPLVLHSYIRQGCVLTLATGDELNGRLHSFWSVWSDS
jgi:cell wall-associated NlpC family hydrolase